MHRVDSFDLMHAAMTLWPALPAPSDSVCRFPSFLSLSTISALAGIGSAMGLKVGLGVGERLHVAGGPDVPRAAPLPAADRAGKLRCRTWSAHGTVFRSATNTSSGGFQTMTMRGLVHLVAPLLLLFPTACLSFAVTRSVQSLALAGRGLPQSAGFISITPKWEYSYMMHIFVMDVGSGGNLSLTGGPTAASPFASRGGGASSGEGGVLLSAVGLLPSLN
jgi:hypothetical protein